ncbi:MAG: DNA primase DnaG [archaeon]
MAKISPVSIKYVIHAKFTAKGTVEKPDVIGALFGQTEGLLGSDLEMRELQKEGKIGRIEVELKSDKGKTDGKIEIPSALDKAETSIIAAAIETIERVGPTDAKIEVEKIEDVRGNKREYILDRAKKLLEGMNDTMPETREITDSVKISNRLLKLQEYGREKLPAGDISGGEIIVVEGRADVINLIKNGINNVICMNGTYLPETIKELSYDKEITLFIDGDRGGILIARNASENARIDFIATAPDGKEVEELNGKEILVALRKKVPVQEFFSPRNNGRSYSRESRENRDNRESRDRYSRDGRPFYRSGRDFERRDQRDTRKRYESADYSEKPVKKIEKELGDAEKEKLRSFVNEVEGKKESYLLDENLELIRKVSSNSLPGTLQRTRKGIWIIVIDGNVTASVIHAAEKKGVAYIVAKNFSYTNTTINLISM